MKSLSSVFIGIVDVLGYSAVERYVDKFGSETAGALLRDVYTTLDDLVSHCFNQATISVRYGDGYVLYTQGREIKSLASMIRGAIKLIALSANVHVPLRVAITQGDIKISESATSGLSITGNGWDRLRELEKALNWMGGWLYLPNYDGHHHGTVTSLIGSTHLIKQQSHCSVPEHAFEAPFKPDNHYSNDRAWFLNWPKVLHMTKDDNDKLIYAWWQSIPGWKNDGAEVLEKQDNTKRFAHYCDTLYHSAKLIFHSGVNSDLKIGEICGGA